MLPIMKRLMVTALLLLCSCDSIKRQKQPAEAVSASPSQAPSPFRAPTATEMFDLQSKCSAMGERILRENSVGVALTQEQVSHYNPKDNRCYVKLSVHTADLTTPREKYTEDDYLEDGQTGEMLAYTVLKGETKSGMVFDASLLKLMQTQNQSNTDASAISDLIDGFVGTDRRP